MSVIAVVVARGGSRRVPRKALQPFGDTTLIGHAVRRLSCCETVDRIVVGSDSEEILVHGAEAGAESILRDAEFCDEDRCDANRMIADMVGRLDAQPEDVILWAHPTNPLVRPETYDFAVRVWRHYARVRDSVVSVSEHRRHGWIRGLPLNHDPLARRHQCGAELSPILLQNGAIFVRSVAALRERPGFVGDSPHLLPMSAIESIDVDTPEDLQLARLLWDHRPWFDLSTQMLNDSVAKAVHP